MVDGAGSPPSNTDADAVGTTINSLTFNLTGNALLRKMALYDGSTELSEGTVSGSTITFSGLSIAASDNSTKTFTVKASFQSSVTDNQQFSINVTQAGTTVSSLGSTMATFSATTSNSGDDNRIEVTVSALNFTTQPTPTSTNIGAAFSPVPVVTAQDANNNTDLDYTNSVIVSTAGSVTFANAPTAFTSGVLNFPVNFIYTSYGDGTLTIDDSNGATTNATSSTITVGAGPCIDDGFANGNTAPSGWTFTGLGTPYTTSSNYGAASPSLKFDDTNDQIVTGYISSPTQLSFWYKGQGTSGANSYLVIEGYSGSTWSLIDTIQPLATTGTTVTYSNSINSFKRFRFTYVKDAGNLSFDDLNVICGSAVANTLTYYRSATSGNWNSTSSWEASANGTSGWTTATVAPDYNSHTVVIRNGHTITLSQNVTIDETIVDAGGFLIINSGVRTTLNDGTGTDLVVNGTITDKSNGTSGLYFSGASPDWQLGSAGTFIKEGNSSSSKWQCHYNGADGSCHNSSIPATSTWIIRQAASSVTVTSSNMYYGNLILENTSTNAWNNSFVQGFQGGSGSDAPIIKGNLDIGGTGSNTVSFNITNTNSTPPSVYGNLIVRDGSALNLGTPGYPGSGIEVKGNITLEDSSAINYGNNGGARELILSGTSTQTVDVAATASLSSYNFTANNTSTGGIVLSNSTINIANQLKFTTGKIVAGSGSLVSLQDNATVSGASNNKYVEGSVAKIGDDAFTFPIGKNGYYRPIGIAAPTSTASIFTAKYIDTNQTLGSSADTSIANLSDCEYWTLTRSGSSDNVNVTLSWNSGSCNAAVANNMRVVGWNGSSWSNYGNGSFAGTATSGTVTSGTTPTTWNAYTLSNKNCTGIATITPSGPTSYCGSGSVNLIAPAGARKYSWLPSGNTQTITVNTTNSYIVKVIDTLGCVGKDTIAFNIWPSPTVNAGTDTLITPGDTIQLNAIASSGTSPYSYLWSPSVGLSNTTIANPYAYPDTLTNYIIEVTDSHGCVKRDTTKINVRGGPVPWLSIEALSCAGVENNILICMDLYDIYLEPQYEYEIHFFGVPTDCGSEVDYNGALLTPIINRPTIMSDPGRRRCFLCTAPAGTVTIKLWDVINGVYRPWADGGYYDEFTGDGLIFETSVVVPPPAEAPTATIVNSTICQGADATINIVGWSEDSESIDWGDGNTVGYEGTVPPPFSHTYINPGTYTINVDIDRCCDAIDDYAEIDGNSTVCDHNSYSFELTVEEIQFELPEKLCVGSQLEISNLGCFDPNTLTIVYDFDGLVTVGPTASTQITLPSGLGGGDHIVTIHVYSGSTEIYAESFTLTLEECCYYDAVSNVDISFQKASHIYSVWHAGQVVGQPTIYDNIVANGSNSANLILTTLYTTGTIFAPDPNTASISINGIFICDMQNVTFDQAHVVLGTNAKIEFDQTGSTRTLNIENSWLQACGLYLWDGIWVVSTTSGSPNRILNVDNSLIEDAINAVVSNNCGDYNISDSRFNKNYKHIIANSCTPISHPSSVYGTTFECNGGTGNILPALPALLGNPTKTKYAIEVNDQNSMLIGSGTQNPNYFHESDIGIYSISSGLRIFNNIFEDYYGGVHNTTPQTWIDNLGTLIIPYKGTAIYYTGTPFRTVALTINGANTSSNNTNSFINCTRGVFTVGNARINISGNTFDNGYCPIYIWNNTVSYIDVKRNDITLSVSPSFSPNRFGIFLNNIGQSHVIAQSNALTFNNLVVGNVAAYHGTGVSIWQPAMYGNNAYNTLDISKNTIKEPQIGIRIVGVKGRKGDDTRDINVYANRIDILENPQANNNLRYGIFNQSTQYAHIQNNWVSSSTTAVTTIEGIRSQNAPTSYVYCNYLNLDGTTNNSINGLDKAITFNSTSLGSRFFNNQMQNSIVGIGTYAGAITGNQASLTRINGNKWIEGTGLTNFTDGRVRSVNTNNSNHTIFTDGALPAVDFDPNYLTGNIGVPTTSKFNLSYPTSNFWTYDCVELKWTWPSPDDGSGTPKALAREIIDDSLDYPVFSTSSTYLGKALAYNWIKDDLDSMLIDTVINNFYIANLTSNIGKLWTIDSLFDSYIVNIRRDVTDSIFIPADSLDYMSPGYGIDTTIVNDIETALLTITPQNRVEQAKVTISLALIHALQRSINPDSTYALDNVYSLNFTPSEWDSIQNYAYLCAYEYGPIVYTARNLLGSVGDSLMNYWTTYVNPCEVGDTSWARTIHSGNNDRNNSKVLLYPNPTTGNIFIQFPESIESGTLQLFSSNGVQLKTIKITGSLMEMYLGDYSDGLYIIRIFDSNNNYIDTKKISLIR